jgi:hypothetical protein
MLHVCMLHHHATNKLMRLFGIAILGCFSGRCSFIVVTSAYSLFI